MTTFLFLSYLVGMATTAAAAAPAAQTWRRTAPGTLTGPGGWAVVHTNSGGYPWIVVRPDGSPVGPGTGTGYLSAESAQWAAVQIHGAAAVPAAPALDRALTFALIEVAMVILMGDLRGTLTLPQRAAYGREARELLEHGVQLARDAVDVSVADGVARAAAAAGHARAVQYCYAVLSPREQVVARGQLAELDYLAHLG